MREHFGVQGYYVRIKGSATPLSVAPTEGQNAPNILVFKATM